MSPGFTDLGPPSAVARSHGCAAEPSPLEEPEVVTYQLLPLEVGGGVLPELAAATTTLTFTIFEPADPALTVTAPV